MPGDKVNAFLEAGDSIYVQDEKLSPVVEVPVTESKSRSASAARSQTVRVRKGDTLGAIAKRNHTPVDRIKRLNGLRSTRINPGQRLRVR